MRCGSCVCVCGMRCVINNRPRAITAWRSGRTVRIVHTSAVKVLRTKAENQIALKKLGAEMPPFRILGACNPGMARKAIEIEPRIGAMLPCNVILRQLDADTEISAIDPVASMQAVENADLDAVAGQVRDFLRAALDAV